MKTGPIADWEMEKARNNARRNAATAVTSTLQRAIQLAQDALFYNDPNLLNTLAERTQKVTAADVQRAAAKYLTKENRSVVITTPSRPRRRAVSDEVAPAHASPSSRRSCLSRVDGRATAGDGAGSGRRRRTVLKGKAPVVERDPEGHVAEAERGGSRERPAPDGRSRIIARRIVNFLLIIEGAGGYYDPADMPGPCRLRRDADAGRHRRRKTSEQISSRARSARGHGRGRRRHLVAVRDGVGIGIDRFGRYRAGDGGRHRDAPVVSASGNRSIQDADESGVDEPAFAAGVSRVRALPACGVRRSSGGARVGDARSRWTR